MLGTFALFGQLDLIEDLGTIKFLDLGLDKSRFSRSLGFSFLGLLGFLSCFSLGCLGSLFSFLSLLSFSLAFFGFGFFAFSLFLSFALTFLFRFLVRTRLGIQAVEVDLADHLQRAVAIGSLFLLRSLFLFFLFLFDDFCGSGFLCLLHHRLRAYGAGADKHLFSFFFLFVAYR